MTARDHFTSNSAYPRQDSSSIFNCLPNWLDFMVRRLGVYFGYFSRLEEAGTSAISIIDIGKKGALWSRKPSFPSSLRDHVLFLFLDSTLLFSPPFPPPHDFPIFFSYFPGEESSSPVEIPGSTVVCPEPII